MNEILESLLDWVFPPRCAVCAEVMPVKKAREVCCMGCLGSLIGPEPPFCVVCGTPMENGGCRCNHCEKTKPAFAANRGLLLYSDDVRRIIHAFKYGNKPRYGTAMGRWMAEGYDDLFNGVAQKKPDMVIPVPLHKEKLQKRGYNQAWLLAEQIQNLKFIEMKADTLVRTKDTTPQSELTAEERSRNLSGAFKVVKPDSVKNKAVLLIDDIFTTGSTMNGCAEALAEAGAESVLCYTFAVVPEKIFRKSLETVN